MESLIYLSEFIGTMLLIILGNGVVYSVSLNKMFANQPGKWIVITMGWGFAVLVGVIVASAMGGEAHLNPAVTAYVLVSTKFRTLEYLAFIPIQILGAIAGQIILNIINFKHIQDTEDMAAIRSSHCTGPAYSHKEGATPFNFLYELVGTLVLVGVIHAFSKLDNLATLGPLPVTFLVMSIGISLGSSTGYAINPARDLGPRLVYFVTEKIIKKEGRDSIGANFSYGWLPVVAPLLGGIIIGAIALA